MVPADEGPGPEGDGRTYFRHAPVVTFSETPCRPGNTFTPLGNDTRKILAELGYPDSDIEALLQQKAISPEGMTESEAVR
jgi:crotonobetainyl-CoA:carnitine CoA-transferase CaiB-like acyl-CoA transferase